MSTNTTDTSTTDTKELNWAKQRADLLMKSVVFEGVERTESNDTVRDTIAAALQQVADQCAEIVEDMPLDTPLPDGDRTAANQFHYSQAIRARFPREGAERCAAIEGPHLSRDVSGELRQHMGSSG